MQSANETKMQELEGKIKDAEENLGDTEVKEALTAKADYLCRIGQCSLPLIICACSPVYQARLASASLYMFVTSLVPAL